MNSPTKSADLTLPKVMSQEEAPDQLADWRRSNGNPQNGELPARTVEISQILGGQALLDRGLNVVAADERANSFAPLAEIVRGAEFVDARARVLNGETAVEFSATVPSLAETDEAESGTALVHMSRLDGVAGPLLLVTFTSPVAELPSVDSLTGVADRRAVAPRLESWRLAAAPGPAKFAVLFLDLDHFKDVNDRDGHAVGDAVLQALAARWQNCVRDDDLVARYGGDEFVLLLHDASAEAEIEPVIRRLQQATSEPLVVGDLTLSITATVGWATSERSEWTVDSLVAAADRDMYARKREQSR